MAEDVGINYRVDDSELIEGLRNYAAYQEAIKNGNEELKNVTKKTFSKSKEQIDKNSESLKNGEKVIGDYKASTSDLGSTVAAEAKNFRVFGVSIGGVVSQFAAWRAALVSAIKGIRGGTAALKVFKVALASTGIGLIVVALGTVITYLTRFQKGMDIVSRVTASASAVFDVLLDRVAKVGGAIVKFISGDFSGAWQDAKSAVADVGEEIAEVSRKAAELARAEQALRDRKIGFIVEEAEAERDLQKARLDAADENLSYEEREKAAAKVLDIEQNLLKEKIAQAKEERRIAIEKAELADNDAEANRILNEAKAKVIRLQTKSNQAQRRYLMDQQRIQKEIAADERKREQERQKAIEKYQQSVEEYNSAIQDVKDTLEKTRIDGLIGVDRIQAEKELALKELDKLEEELKKKAREAGKAYTAGEDFVELRKHIEQNAQDETSKYIIEKKKEELGEKQKLELSELELIQESTDSKLNLEQFKQKRKLEIERETQKKLLPVIEEQYGADSVEAKLARNHIKLLNNQITNIQKEAQGQRVTNLLSYLDKQLKKKEENLKKEKELELSRVDLIKESGDESLSLEEFKERKRLEIKLKYLQEDLEIAKARYGEDSIEVELLDNHIAILEEKIEGIGKEVDLSVLEKIRDKIQDALGLDDDQFVAVEEAFAQTFSNIANIISQNTDAAIEENKRLLDSIRDRIDDTESLLEEEQEKQREGYANNVESKEKELAELQAKEKAAQKQQEELRKEKLRQELTANIAQQASSLATTAAQLFQSFGTIPLGLGIPLAIAAITGMYATFKKFKNQAKQSAEVKLKGGGPVDQILQGRTDRGSGRGHRVEDSNLVLGGEEYVINGLTTKKNRSFLDKFNKGEFDHIDIQKTLKVGQLFQNGFKPAPSLSAELAGPVQKMNEEIGSEKRTGQSYIDQKVELAISKQTEDLKAYFDKRPQYIPKKKGYIEKSKGVTRHVDLD